MRDFEIGTRAQTLPRPARALYAAFAALTALGLITSIVLYADVVRFSAHATPRDLFENVLAHYSRGQGDPPPEADLAGRRLLETTHAHLFTIPVLLLVCGHLFLLTGHGPRVKGWSIGVAISATTIHILVPWGIRLGGWWLALLYPISGGLMLATYGWMLAATFVEMWQGRTARAGGGAGT